MGRPMSSSRHAGTAGTACTAVEEELESARAEVARLRGRLRAAGLKEW